MRQAFLVSLLNCIYNLQYSEIIKVYYRLSVFIHNKYQNQHKFMKQKQM